MITRGYPQYAGYVTRCCHRRPPTTAASTLPARRRDGEPPRSRRRLRRCQRRRCRPCEAAGLGAPEAQGLVDLLPSGYSPVTLRYPLVIQYSHGKSPFLVGKPSWGLQEYGDYLRDYLLVMTNSLPLKMAHGNSWFTELKDGDFP